VVVASGTPNPQPEDATETRRNRQRNQYDHGHGERKQMFGFNARHIKTSMVRTASPEACDKDMKIETDGWYIDFQLRCRLSN
jgi:hypothetical protein